MTQIFFLWLAIYRRRFYSLHAPGKHTINLHTWVFVIKAEETLYKKFSANFYLLFFYLYLFVKKQKPVNSFDRTY